MNIKNVALSFLILSTGFLSYSSQNEISFQEQDEIIKCLYEGNIELSTLNHETVVQYIKALKNHKIILQHTIAKHSGYFNSADAMRGTLGAWLSFQWIFNITFWAAFDIAIRYDQPLFHFTMKQLKDFIQSYPKKMITHGCFMILSLWLAKKSCSLLNKAWHAKEYALKDLAKAEELLVQLEKIEPRLAS